MTVVYISFTAFIVALCALWRARKDRINFNAEISRLQLELADARRILKHRVNLANEIAHEIKNPITAILCSADTLDLLIGSQLDETNRKSLHYIREYGDNLLRMVSDFLDVSRAESGLINAKPQPTRVCPLIESIMGLLGPSADRKNISLHFETEDTDTVAQVDPIHLKQIVFNLMHNAIKFTPSMGTIKISVKNLPQTDQVRLSVQDSGVGIPADKLSNLFDPYTRYESQASGVFGGIRTAVGSGVGLGLALCKSLVQLAHGSIEVRSAVGVGTIFEFSLPRVYTTSQAISAVEEKKEEYSRRPLEGQTFLVVNDAATECTDTVAKLIEAWGGMVDQVNKAADALAAINGKEYDAVYVDDSIAQAECSQLVDGLALSPASFKTKIIMAGNEDDVDRHAAKLQFIEKPFSGKLLLRSLLNSGKFEITHSVAFLTAVLSQYF